MVVTTDILFQLLQVADGRRSRLDEAPTALQWERLFEQSKEQAIVGICADGIERLPEEQRPPRKLLLQWGFITARIEQRNTYLNGQTVRIFRKLNEDGFDACLLKGQGVAAYYPNPLRRQSGDIDVWAMPKGMFATGNMDFDRCRKAIVEYAHECSADAEICLHNIVFPVIRDIPMELHFLPFYFNSYFATRRIKKYLRRQAAHQFSNVTSLGVPCPTDEFNMVFLLAHIFRHFLQEGIGLRQIMDYYYLTNKWVLDGKLDDRKTMDRLRHDLKTLGLYRFCGAVMWVLQKVFGLEHERMIVKPDKVLGELLLGKIISGGNFGHYMTDNPFACKPDDGHVMRLYKRTMSGMQQFRHYPSECIWNLVRIVEMFFILRFDKIKTNRE